MTDDEIQAVFAESQRLLEWTEDLKFERRDALAEDVLEKWDALRRKSMPAAPSVAPVVRSAAAIEKQRTADWARYVDSRISKALDRHDAIRREAIGRIIAAERKRHSDQIARLERQIAAVAGEVTKLRQTVSETKGVPDGAEVVELPQFLPERRRNVA